MLPRNVARLCAALIVTMRRVLLKTDVAIRFLENQKLAHLFMICSNIKLTDPEESIELAV
jgi:hypothetical protein